MEAIPMSDRRRLIEWMSKAVEQKQLLKFEYQGFMREVCPHLLGVSKEGRLVLHAFQHAGSSSTGSVASPEEGNWRFFYLDQIPAHQIVWNLGPGNWYPPKLAKTEAGKEYVPPRFIATVLALHPKE